MIIDSFIFFNELDMLESRLNYLDSYVDHFVIVESNRSYTGIKKDLIFDSNKLRFKKFIHKITYLPFLPKSETVDSWTFEFNQRDHITNGIKQFSGDDIVIVSDIDEIPNPILFTPISKFLDENENNVARLIQSMFLYNLQTKQIVSWERSYLTKVTTVLEQTPSWLRAMDDKNCYHNFSIRPDKFYPKVNSQKFDNGGWHLSYFMSVDEIVKKIESFSHTEYNTDYMKDKTRIKKCIDNATDMFDRQIPCKSVNVNEEFNEEFLSAFDHWRL